MARDLRLIAPKINLRDSKSTLLIAGKTDTPENLRAIEAFVRGSKWETLPQNKLAGAKYAGVGREYLCD